MKVYILTYEESLSGVEILDVALTAEDARVVAEGWLSFFGPSKDYIDICEPWIDGRHLQLDNTSCSSFAVIEVDVIMPTDKETLLKLYTASFKERVVAA